MIDQLCFSTLPRYQDCWHTDAVRYLADLACMLDMASRQINLVANHRKLFDMNIESKR